MKNRKILLLIGTVLLTVTASGGLKSCEDIAGLSLDPGVKGVWYDAYTEVVISDYLFYPSSTSDGTFNYTATVIEHVEDTWNAGDNPPGDVFDTGISFLDQFI